MTNRPKHGIEKDQFLSDLPDLRLQAKNVRNKAVMKLSKLVEMEFSGCHNLVRWSGFGGFSRPQKLRIRYLVSQTNIHSIRLLLLNGKQYIIGSVVFLKWNYASYFEYHRDFCLTRWPISVHWSSFVASYLARFCKGVKLTVVAYFEPWELSESLVTLLRDFPFLVRNN